MFFALSEALCAGVMGLGAWVCWAYALAGFDIDGQAAVCVAFRGCGVTIEHATSDRQALLIAASACLHALLLLWSGGCWWA
jgi:hypothetical protein